MSPPPAEGVLEGVREVEEAVLAGSPVTELAHGGGGADELAATHKEEGLGGVEAQTAADDEAHLCAGEVEGDEVLFAVEAWGLEATAAFEDGGDEVAGRDAVELASALVEGEAATEWEHADGRGL